MSRADTVIQKKRKEEKNAIRKYFTDFWTTVEQQLLKR